MARVATPNANNAADNKSRPGATNIAPPAANIRTVSPPARANNALPICVNDIDPNICNGTANATKAPARINSVAAPNSPAGPTIDNKPTATNNIPNVPIRPPKATTMPFHGILDSLVNTTPMVTNTGTNESNTKAAPIAPNIFPDMLVMAITDMVSAAIIDPKANKDGTNLSGFISAKYINPTINSFTEYENTMRDAKAVKLTLAPLKA